MKGDAQPLIKFFDGSDKRFIIPLYQRNYDWKNVDDLQRLKEQAYNKKEMQFKIFIVQPGVSKKSATDSMRILLGNTYKFLRESANIPLKVICSQ